jgi:hypothetical protein
MARPERFPVTRAIHALRAAGVGFEPHLYAYEPGGGTRVSAAALGVDEHRVVSLVSWSLRLAAAH